MHQRGFTLVELVVAIAIMGVLLTIGAISLTNSQVDARDRERLGDIENIARSLESYYTANNGSYPATTIMDSETLQTTTLAGMSSSAYRAPNVASGTSIIVAINNTATPAGVRLLPTISQYNYQPIASDGTLCNDVAKECRSFSLYYREERTNTVVQFSGKNK